MTRVRLRALASLIVTASAAIDLLADSTGDLHDEAQFKCEIDTTEYSVAFDVQGTCGLSGTVTLTRHARQCSLWVQNGPSVGLPQSGTIKDNPDPRAGDVTLSDESTSCTVRRPDGTVSLSMTCGPAAGADGATTGGECQALLTPK